MHLDEVKMIDNDEKAQPVHVVLGASEYARIKMKSGQKVGLPGEPVTEKTAFWVDNHVAWKRDRFKQDAAHSDLHRGL